MDRKFWISLSMITAVGPLSCLRKLDSLKYTSLIALFAVVYLVAIVVYHYFSPSYPLPPPEAIEYFRFSTKVFGQLPVFIFAFTCHQNVSHHVIVLKRIIVFKTLSILDFFCLQ